MTETVLTALLSGALFGWAGWLLARRSLTSRVQCYHEFRRGIYGDEIYMSGGWRLQCISCQAYLWGPAEDATVERRSADLPPHDSYSEGEEL